ncbi:hypothetical protein IFM89_001986 [Coptis chinensis]|uniref:Vacuolar import/degradation Vid27 C-terminal domain-containing protein n=1 Tax=Coptis chinensis TaxID=261450 RepID=A0A835LUG5_9MAGN|nr:hypothetical protein IFM89_001986 [Coptis chinensis]
MGGSQSREEVEEAKFQTPTATLDEVDLTQKKSVKLYLHTPKAKWIVSDKITTYTFVKSSEDENEETWWLLRVGDKVRVKDCLFENVYRVEATEANKVKVYGKDFVGWAKGEVADDSVWEDVEDGCGSPTPVTQNLMEEFDEAALGGGIQSLALGALENSFLVGGSGVEVVKNFSNGIQGKGVYVKFDNGSSRFGSHFGHSVSTPKKALLMRAETNMLLMNSTTSEVSSHSTGLHQFDIETGRIVSQWNFEKDGADITMRDITNDSKGSQLDPSASTFLGLDDNRLCRWDMRDRKGMVQNLASESTPVLNWTQGHQFSRGTNFQCFATTGDGSIVVGSIDGKIRLYSTTSMRQAKTAFPGLGSPITHVDVTYDGKWILGTTDNYLVLISTMFTDTDGISKTGFNGRMGHRIAAPRLLKLTPLDSHLAGVNNKFHGGQFSWVTENGKQERHLVATVGKFSVIWNFQQVKNSAHECYQNQEGLKSCYCYRIVLKAESIVDSRFMHDKFSVSDSPEAPLVVATPMKVSSFSISSRQ